MSADLFNNQLKLKDNILRFYNIQTRCTKIVFLKYCYLCRTSNNDSYGTNKIIKVKTASNTWKCNVNLQNLNLLQFVKYRSERPVQIVSSEAKGSIYILNQ